MRFAQVVKPGQHNGCFAELLRRDIDVKVMSLHKEPNN